MVSARVSADMALYASSSVTKLVLNACTQHHVLPENLRRALAQLSDEELYKLCEVAFDEAKRRRRLRWIPDGESPPIVAASVRLDGKIDCPATRRGRSVADPWLGERRPRDVQSWNHTDANCATVRHLSIECAKARCYMSRRVDFGTAGVHHASVCALGFPLARPCWRTWPLGLACISCSEPLPARESSLFLKYFLIERPKPSRTDS